MGYFDDKDSSKPNGILYDVANLIASRAGLSYKNSIMPFARVVEELNNGRVHYSLFFSSKAHEKYAQEVGNCCVTNSVIFLKKGVKVKKYEDLRGLTIVGVRQGKYSEKFEQDTSINKAFTNSYINGIHQVLDKNKKIDGIVLPHISMLNTLKTHDISLEDNFEKESFSLNENTIVIQFSKKNFNKVIVEKLQKALHEVQSDGSLAKIFIDHGVESVVRSYHQ